MSEEDQNKPKKLDKLAEKIAGKLSNKNEGQLLKMLLGLYLIVFLVVIVLFLFGRINMVEAVITIIILALAFVPLVK